MSGSIRVSVISKYCRIHYDDGLCVNYSSHNGEDANRAVIMNRQKKVLEFIKEKVEMHEYLFLELIKSGISILVFDETAKGHIIKIVASDYIKTYHQVIVEVMIADSGFNEIVIKKLKPLLISLVE